MRERTDVPGCDANGATVRPRVVHSMSMIPRVELMPLAIGPLGAAVRDGTLPDGFSAEIPRDRDGWNAQIERCREPMMGTGWAETLRDALRPTGVAAARLARVANGQGVVVTTGQQPGLFGGPMYTLVKALSALTLANRIESLTGVPTAPIFWAATDDADFAEGATTWMPVAGDLRDARLLTAPPDGTMMSHAFLGDLETAKSVLLRASAGAAWPEFVRAAIAAYHGGTTVGSAYVALMREMLMPLGISVLNAAHPSVRHQSAPLLRRALAEAGTIDAALVERTGALQAAGFTPQVELVEDRSLVFVVRNGVKERASISGAPAILPKVSDDLLSPNVLMRPVVERALLPTVAYVAGPGELAYFAQVGAVAQALSVAMPLALPRASLRIIPPDVQTTLSRVGQSADDLRDTTALVRALSTAATPDAALDAITILRAQIQHTAQTIRDAGTELTAAALDGTVAQLTHRVARLERRVLAATKRTIGDQLRRVSQAQAILWPHGAPQERVVNPLPWLARYGTPLLDAMQGGCATHAESLVHGGD